MSMPLWPYTRYIHTPASDVFSSLWKIHPTNYRTSVVLSINSAPKIVATALSIIIGLTEPAVVNLRITARILLKLKWTTSSCAVWYGVVDRPCTNYYTPGGRTVDLRDSSRKAGCVTSLKWCVDNASIRLSTALNYCHLGEPLLSRRGAGVVEHRGNGSDTQMDTLWWPSSRRTMRKAHITFS